MLRTCLRLANDISARLNDSVFSSRRSSRGCQRHTPAHTITEPFPAVRAFVDDRRHPPLSPFRVSSNSQVLP